MSGHSTRPYFVVYALLMVLLALTVGAATQDFQAWNFPIAMLIATVKAGLILVIFMHLRESSALTWLFASAALVWLAIMLGLSLNDYLFRMG